MNDPLSLKNDAPDRSWLSQEITKSRAENSGRFLGWWHRWTTRPEPPPSASFVKRDAARRERLFSAVCFFFLIILVMFFPASFWLSNHLVVYYDIAMISTTIFTLFLNRLGHPSAAGIILVIAAEGLMALMIITTSPFNESSIQFYDLYVVVELLSISLIAPRYVFILALCNSLFIWGDLVYQPHTAALANDLVTQFSPILMRAVVLQVIVAGVAYIWVSSATRAIKRAERAEMVATLEHMIAEERKSFELSKKQLEDSIQQLIKLHTESMNKQMIAKIPYPPEAKVLWPLIGVINSLWMRLQNAHHTEDELLQLKQAIARYTEILHQAASSPQHQVPIYHTRTDLDALILAVGNLQRT